jgi:hypothetical protein
LYIITLEAAAEAEAEPVRPGAGRKPGLILQELCFKLTIPLPKNLAQQWQRAVVSPGKQISGQFNSVNPRTSNRPSARMELDILTWLNEPFHSFFFTCVFPQLPVCRLRFPSTRSGAQRTGYPQMNISPFEEWCLLGCYAVWLL